MMFNKILIANRGEIACRIISTVRRMGIKSVAVFSDADAGARHVDMADEAYHIGPPPVAESYLSIDRIIEVCKASGADAIHPGYGFLSENPDLVQATEAAGLTFIGPSATAIRAMGLKDAAKVLMEQTGVPVVPGYHGDDQDPDTLEAHADAIGYPVLIKARAGGGGKGMRRVDDPSDFLGALDSASREAEASFGDGRCLIEKYLTKPRHIEIQVFGDRHGNVVHLFERDCSLQRRHQKIIEEAPAPGMTEEMRHAMGEGAVRAAKAIDYAGAGTIEFIADVEDGLRPDRFYFMEMNTRLQVEHPVTEMITGQDLVAWQIRVAAGEPLPLSQEDLKINGWAFEARLYAEDVAKGFLPATGKLDHLTFPMEKARIDSGVRPGDEITPFYDPMIAKLIVHGESREQALSHLAEALSKTRISGTVTNLGFLAALTAHSDFAKGELDTGLVERDGDELTEVNEPPGQVWTLAAVCAIGLLREEVNTSDTPTDPWARKQGWRLWGKATETAVLSWQESIDEVNISIEGPNAYRVTTPKGDFNFTKVKVNGVDVQGLMNGIKVNAGVIRQNDFIGVFLGGQVFNFAVPDPLQTAAEADTASDHLRAPMPGMIKVVHASSGQSVSKDAPLLVMEAMKMEQTLKAPRDGIVEQCFVDVGDQVEEGALLLQLQS